MSGGPAEGVVEIFLRVPPVDIAYVKFIFESYEGVAIVRTVDRAAAVIVLLVAPDFAGEARRILAGIRDEVAWEELEPPLAR